MKLRDLLNTLSYIRMIGSAEDSDVLSIEYDSRKVSKNSLFTAIQGEKTDGHNFIDSAIQSGSNIIVLENEKYFEKYIDYPNVVFILVKFSRLALAQLSNSFYGNPSSEITLIGVTGTKGKTTTTFIIKNILEKQGFKVGLIGTIANYIGDKKLKSSLTTPESNDLNKILFEMINAGCSYCVMEVSSHSLVLGRVYGLQFKYAIFTNITSDHLDFHGNFENYLKAKKILFDQLNEDAWVILNADDKSHEKMIENSKAKIFKYGTIGDSELKVENISFDIESTSFSARYSDKRVNLSMPLIGRFNALNAAAAFALGLLENIPDNIISQGISKMNQIPGRFEVIEKNNKKVIVDYSHTADSLEQTLTALNYIVKNERKIYTVFGCGGDRDRTKRPVMGKIAGNLSDHVIVTSDNPRAENPMSIINEIVTGIESNNYKIIKDRELAIKTAILNSEDDAVILIAGKGHEDYQEINGIRNHFSDKETAERFLNYE